MSGSHITLSSEEMDYQTPRWFLDLVERVSPLAIDPATCASNPVGAPRFYAPDRRNASTDRCDVVGFPCACGAWHKLGDADLGGWLGPCGLRGEWDRGGDGQAFVNPRYGAFLSGPVAPSKEVWRKKKGERVLIGVGTGWAARIAQETEETTALVPVRTETEWWRTLYAWSDLVCFWSSREYGSRISFIDPRTGEPKHGSNLASCVFYRGPNVRQFLEVFTKHGTVVTGGHYERVIAQVLSESAAKGRISAARAAGGAR